MEEEIKTSLSVAFVILLYDLCRIIVLKARKTLEEKEEKK